VQDDPGVLAVFAEAWKGYEGHRDVGKLCRALLGRSDFWGEDLAARGDLTDAVAAHLARILATGAREAVRAIL
jgi:mannitol-1-phosphate/altronate dehydrogenase